MGTLNSLMIFKVAEHIFVTAKIRITYNSHIFLGEEGRGIFV